MGETLTQYENHKGEVITIAKLEDIALVKNYKFFQNYCKILNNTLLSENVIRDNQYTEHVAYMLRIRDSLKSEIVSRKLKINSF